MTPDPREILRRLPATEPDPRECSRKCSTELAILIVLAAEVGLDLRIMYPNPVTLTN